MYAEDTRGYLGTGGISRLWLELRTFRITTWQNSFTSQIQVYVYENRDTQMYINAVSYYNNSNH